MSDEQPPPLRLKPRAPSNSETPPSPPPPAPPTPAPEAAPSEASIADPAVPKLRLKPKLVSTDSATAARVESPAPEIPNVNAPAPIETPITSKPAIAAAETPAAPTSPATPVSAPNSASTETFAAVPEPPAVKPNENLSEPEPAASDVATPAFSFTLRPHPATPPPPPPPLKRNLPPPVPDEARNFPPPPPLPRESIPAENNEAASVAPAIKRSPLKLFLGIAAAAVVVAGAGIGYRFLKAKPPAAVAAPRVVPEKTAAAPVATPAARTPAVVPSPTPVPAVSPARPKGPTPSDTLNELAATPLREINKAKSVVAAHRDAISDIPAIDAHPSSPAAAAGGTHKTPAAVAAAPQAAPSAAALEKVSDPAGVASDAFRAWAANAKISGVFQGTPPRALINGRIVQTGQAVDETLGINFDSFDSATKTIVFRDATGATIARKF